MATRKIYREQHYPARTCFGMTAELMSALASEAEAQRKSVSAMVRSCVEYALPRLREADRKRRGREAGRKAGQDAA